MDVGVIPSGQGAFACTGGVSVALEFEIFPCQLSQSRAPHPCGGICKWKVGGSTNPSTRTSPDTRSLKIPKALNFPTP